MESRKYYVLMDLNSKEMENILESDKNRFSKNIIIKRSLYTVKCTIDSGLLVLYLGILHLDLKVKKIYGFLIVCSFSSFSNRKLDPYFIYFF